MPPKISYKGFTAEQLRDLIRVARLAWNHAPDSARKARFHWQGKCYYATHSTFFLKVYTTSWNEVVVTWD